MIEEVEDTPGLRVVNTVRTARILGMSPAELAGCSAVEVAGWLHVAQHDSGVLDANRRLREKLDQTPWGGARA